VGGVTARLDPDVVDTKCRNCGTHVTERFAAVFGDDADDVHRCPACDSMPRINRGSAAGRRIESRVDPTDDGQAFRLSGARTRAVAADGGDDQ